MANVPFTAKQEGVPQLKKVTGHKTQIMNHSVGDQLFL